MGRNPLGRKIMKNCKAGLGLFAALLILLTAAAAAEKPALTFAFKTINIPGSTETDIFGVNNSQVGVGSYVDGKGIRHGFMLAGKKLTKIDDPKGVTTYCFAINNLNAVV